MKSTSAQPLQKTHRLPSTHIIYMIVCITQPAIIAVECMQTADNRDREYHIHRDYNMELLKYQVCLNLIY